MSRDKGATFERGISKVLRILWPDARRGIGQARAGGEVPDIAGTPYWIEAKHRKRVSIRKAMAQAHVATDGRPVVAITRENGEPIFVTMGLTDWLDLNEKAGRE